MSSDGEGGILLVDPKHNMAIGTRGGVGLPWWLGGALIVALFGIVVRVWLSLGPGGDGVLALYRHADGSEYAAVQCWNDWFEPYTVSLYHREAGGAWLWSYIAHQDSRWRNVRFVYDERNDALQLWRGENMRAELLRSENELRVHMAGTGLWSTRAAGQVQRAPPVWLNQDVFVDIDGLQGK